MPTLFSKSLFGTKTQFLYPTSPHGTVVDVDEEDIDEEVVLIVDAVELVVEIVELELDVVL